VIADAQTLDQRARFDAERLGFCDDFGIEVICIEKLADSTKSCVQNHEFQVCIALHYDFVLMIL